MARHYSDVDDDAGIELGLLTNLRDLLIMKTNVTSTLPLEYANLNVFKDMFLSFSQISGTIPSEYRLLTNVEILSPEYNKLVCGASVIMLC